MKFEVWDRVNNKTLDAFKIVLSKSGQIQGVQTIDGEFYGPHQANVIVHNAQPTIIQCDYRFRDRCCPILTRGRHCTGREAENRVLLRIGAVDEESMCKVRRELETNPLAHHMFKLLSLAEKEKIERGF